VDDWIVFGFKLAAVIVVGSVAIDCWRRWRAWRAWRRRGE